MLHLEASIELSTSGNKINKNPKFRANRVSQEKPKFLTEDVFILMNNNTVALSSSTPFNEEIFLEEIFKLSA